ncbi:hypothetical protein [Nonomuraea sediminis]|nr:hypothetical protein [Nonomuraea sediminis]
MATTAPTTGATTATPRRQPAQVSGPNPCATFNDFRRPYCEQVMRDLAHR